MTAVRAFVAIEARATAPLRKVIRELAEMGRAVRAPDSDHLHLTLKFLGDTPRESVPEIARILEQSAAAEPAFTARIKGLGAFPHAERPTVIWAGLEDADPLVRLAASLESQLEPLGFPAESRRYHPHVTLARIKFKPPPELGTLLATHAAISFGELRVESLKLYQSELRPEGSRYTVLATARLG